MSSTVYNSQIACRVVHVSTICTHIPYSELAGLFLIDPAAETLFDADPDPESHSDLNKEQVESSNEFKTPWSHYWYRQTVPHLQSVHVSGSLGFNRLGIMVGLMSAVEIPELQKILSDNIIAIRVSIDLSGMGVEFMIYFVNVEASSVPTKAPFFCI